MAFKVLCVDHVGVAVKDLALIKQQMKDILGLDPSLPDETVEEQHVTTSFFKPSAQTEACELEFLGSTTPDCPSARFIEKANGGKITVEVQQSDSTTGITSAAEGICDIGMASRELKDEETKENLTATEIARDGIAVVVNNDNDIDELTSDQVKAIFTGETTDWEDLAK